MELSKGKEQVSKLRIHKTSRDQKKKEKKIAKKWTKKKSAKKKRTKNGDKMRNFQWIKSQVSMKSKQ